MPLVLLRSDMALRLGLAPRLLLASFLRRSRTVSWVWPWPLGRPPTWLGGGSGLYLEGRGGGASTQASLKKVCLIV